MEINETKLNEFMNKVVSDVGAAMSGALVVLGLLFREQIDLKVKMTPTFVDSPLTIFRNHDEGGEEDRFQ